jgi:hypothetical protein
MSGLAMLDIRPDGMSGFNGATICAIQGGGRRPPPHAIGPPREICLV